MSLNNNYNKYPVMVFNNDDEFTNFCLAPYALAKVTNTGTPYYTGVYSNIYLKSLAEGIHFVIKDENSVVYKHRCVSKRLPLRVENFPGYHRDVLVQMPVENLDEYFQP